eukprot:scaffold85082_cov40-Cyclotella_meneghiniana.AAC.2
MNPNTFALNIITDAVTDTFVTLGDTYEDPGPVDDIVPHPNREGDVFGKVFYHTARDHPIVQEITNNIPISIIATRVVDLMSHYGLDGIDDDTLPQNIEESLPQSLSSFSGLHNMLNNADKLRSMGMIGGGGGGGGDGHDDGGDDDDLNENDSDVEDGDDGEFKDKDTSDAAAAVKRGRKQLKDKAIEGNKYTKITHAVLTFKSFLEFTLEASRASLRAAQVEVRTFAQAVEKNIEEPFAVRHVQHLHRIMIRRRDQLRKEHELIKKELKKSLATLHDLKNQKMPSVSTDTGNHTFMPIIPTINNTGNVSPNLTPGSLTSYPVNVVQTCTRINLDHPLTPEDILLLSMRHERIILDDFPSPAASSLDIQEFVEKLYVLIAKGKGNKKIERRPMLTNTGEQSTFHSFVTASDRFCRERSEDPTLRPTYDKLSAVFVRSNVLRENPKPTDFFRHDGYDVNGKTDMILLLQCCTV